MVKTPSTAVAGPTGEYRFEVMARRDGRWVIDGVMDEEATARSRAEGLINSRACEEVKVTRQLLRRNGDGFSSEILHLKARGKEAKSFALSGDPTRAPACVGLEDFYRWESRRFLASLFRGYLQHHALIPSELLYYWRHAKALLDSGSLPYDALRRVAAVQAEREGVAAEARIAALEVILRQAIERSQELQASSRAFMEGRSIAPDSLPPLKGVAGLDARALAAASLSASLARVGHLEGKLTALLDLLPEAGQGWFACVEEMAAECFFFAESLEIAFPGLADRISLIQALADMVEGRDTAPAVRRSPRLAALAKMISYGSAPHCQGALRSWLAPMIRGREPLDRNRPANELRLIEQLSRRLRRADGAWIGGEAVAKAVELRRARTREKTLRGLGMDSAADALGRSAVQR